MFFEMDATKADKFQQEFGLFRGFFMSVPNLKAAQISKMAGLYMIFCKCDGERMFSLDKYTKIC